MLQNVRVKDAIQGVILKFVEINLFSVAGDYLRVVFTGKGSVAGI
jgi:hypothetical protein